MRVIIKHTYQSHNVFSFFKQPAESYVENGHTPFLLKHPSKDHFTLCIELTDTLKQQLREPHNDPDIQEVDPSRLYYWPDHLLQCPECSAVINRKNISNDELHGILLALKNWQME